MQDRLDEAEPLCRKAIEENPGYDEPYNTLGILEFKRGKFAEAEIDFQNALARSPMYVYPLINLAQAQARQGKAVGAENSLSKAVEVNNGAASPAFAAALSDTAAAYADQGNYEKAVENLNRLLYIQPYDARSHAELGLMLYMLKRYDEAEAEAQASLSLDQGSAEAWNTLGLIKLAKGDTASAVTAFQQVMTIDPKYPGAKENLDKANGAKTNTASKNT
jgi:tetratricopeptide (TPR) repeat protein